MTEILWLGDKRCEDPVLAGGKAANLSRMSRFHHVPAGFVVTAPAVAAARAGGSPGAAWGALPRRLAGQVLEAHRRLVAGQDGPAGVAVRSSALDEDGATTSFAGQHVTVLNVAGEEPLLAAIGQCLRSYESEPALAYRAHHGLFARPGGAVLIQRQVVADVSAVLFTANPATGDRDEVVINATWGLGESLVDGTITPDTYIVGRTDPAASSRRVRDKRSMAVAVPGGTLRVDVPAFLRRRPALADAQVAELVDVGLRLERAAGHPVDVECAYRHGRLHMLQCRAITTATGAALAG
jgi:pyruvate,water dikinase